ncbi:hypothetical protein HPB48_021683 [Haemaphysalis longicornis]|uniref:Endonuclease/exonuclease/phosphatase domain-containing protein n=1 Tax=Haemaphysalis longicornis TaxID=44386 RepID=A0A9J6FEY7_HAELO|nr:hypothetical protein HPB48_021683 [Haemaphysalis longicornis]
MYTAPQDYTVMSGTYSRWLTRCLIGHSLVWLVDFNAPHPAWGYPRPTKKGQQVFDTLQQLNLSVLTDPAHPTRQGNSVQRNTTLDQSIVKNGKSPQWRNTLIDLGSDHYIVETLLVAGPTKSVGRKHTVIDWDLLPENPTNARLS